MTTLFDLSGYTSPVIPIHDPYWDEIVLTQNGTVDTNGQATLFYDDSQEPPDPDEFPSLDDYYEAWSEWERQYPDLAVLVGEQVKKTPKLQDCGTSLVDKKSGQVRFDTAHQHTQFVEKYCVKRSGKSHYYYRHTSMTGRTMKRTYIGAVKSPKATAIVEKVRQAIAQGESPVEIQRVIRSSKIATG